MDAVTIPASDFLFFLSCTAGGSERAGGVAGVCRERRRPREAPRLLPSVQGDRPQHHSLPRGGHWRHHCHRGGPRPQHQHDASVRTDHRRRFCRTNPAASVWKGRHPKTPVLSLCSVDCVGILKLRNADVEARIGVAGSKKKSTRARLVFRVNIPRPDGSVLTLQTPSSPILCSKSFPLRQHPFFYPSVLSRLHWITLYDVLRESLANGVIILLNLFQDSKLAADLSRT